MTSLVNITVQSMSKKGQNSVVGGGRKMWFQKSQFFQKNYGNLICFKTPWKKKFRKKSKMSNRRRVKNFKLNPFFHVFPLYTGCYPNMKYCIFWLKEAYFQKNIMRTTPHNVTMLYRNKLVNLTLTSFLRSQRSN